MSKPRNTVLISWSGSRSYSVAKALRKWIPKIIPHMRIWLSAADISIGERWGSDLQKKLKAVGCGIACVTPECLQSPWVFFEAGAISGATGRSIVCPYLVGVDPRSIVGPLAQYQAATADADGTRALIHSINSYLPSNFQLQETQLDSAFDEQWPALEECLGDLPSPEESLTDLDERIIRASTQVAELEALLKYLRSEVLSWKRQAGPRDYPL